MAPRLLERDVELEVLGRAVAAAARGRGSVVLVHGEAGVGKTALVSELVRRLPAGVRALTGACDDLVTPRTLGPLHDAAADGGPLAAALRDHPDRERVYRALLAELSRRGQATVLVVEDVHWADDATLDALRFLVRRIAASSGVVVLTYRDDELVAEHPLRRLLGLLHDVPVHRLPLRRLSRGAVAQLGEAAGADAAAVFAATGGNAFFVTEALASPAEAVPVTVVDAVMARLQPLSARTRAALEQLSVVPTAVDRALVEALVGGLEAVAEAEEHGIVELRPAGLTFRHELARRAVEHGLCAARRVALHGAVLDVLLARPGVDPSRVVHHAVAAGRPAVVASWGLRAARQAAAVGSHRQSLAHYEHVVAALGELPERAQAQVLVEHAWQLHLAQRHEESVEVARDAALRWELLGDPVALGTTLVVQSRSAYMADQPAAAWAVAERAVRVLEGTGDRAALAHARTHAGALLALTDREPEALAQLAAAAELAAAVGRADLAALCRNYRGCARVALGDEGGLDDLRESLADALSLHEYEYAARAWTNVGESLFQLARYDELERCIADGLPYLAEHDLPGHAYNLRAHAAMLLLARGRWDAAEALLRKLVDAVPDPGQLARHTLPALGRLLARRGSAEAAEVLERAWRSARRGGALQALAPAGLACVEAAWLAGDVGGAEEQVGELLERTAGPAGARRRGELLRYLARAGRPAPAFAGCPEQWAAGLRGDWQAAADAWQRIGDPYERALELAESGEVAPTLEALAVLDRLGARPAAALVRRRLRALGVAHVPRAAPRARPVHPTGLSERQLEVLALLREGLTNREIGERLVLSTRTVDTHVAAVLAKLGVPSRREAVRAARDLALPVAGPRPVGSAAGRSR